jgi:hypothetical protein
MKYFYCLFIYFCGLTLPVSSYGIFSFPYGHPVGAHFFSLVFPSLVPFLLSFLQRDVSEGSSYARGDQSN